MSKFICFTPEQRRQANETGVERAEALGQNACFHDAAVVLLPAEFLPPAKDDPNSLPERGNCEVLSSQALRHHGASGRTHSIGGISTEKKQE